MEISRDKIKGIEQLRGEFVRGEYRRIDPNRSRLIFGPTARPVKAGQGYFSAYEIFFPFLAFGIADILTIAGGISLVPGAKDQLFYIAPKVTIPIPSETVNFAAGVLYLNLTGGTEDNTGGGIVYGVGTFGSQYASLTAGLGYGFAQGDFSEQPVIMIGGEAQVSNSIALLTENYIAPGSESTSGLLSFGIRFFGDKLAADLAFFYPLTESGTSGFPFLPWLGFTYNFGTKAAR